MAEVREAIAADIPALARLHLAAWRLAYDGILPRHILAALTVSEFERIWASLLKDPQRRTLVACPQTEASGFVAYRLEPEPEIIGLYVDPAQWRGGLGSLLMTSALGRMAAAGVGRVILWVMRDNGRARAFYEHAGFSLTGRKRESSRYDVRFDEVEYGRAPVRDGRAAPTL
jgi:ribosomal protein S18 acetylase RimI-like enzyme